MQTVETQLNEKLLSQNSEITLDLRSHVIDIKKRIDKLFLELAKNLSEIYHKEYYLDWGYKTFETYVVGELDFSYRKAVYYVNIWDRVKNTELDLGRIEEVGWTKMAEIARIINDDNAEIWLEKAETLSQRDLNCQIKKVIDTSVQDNRPKITYMKFRLDSVDASVINEAISESCRINSTTDVALSLAQICDEWLLTKGTAPTAMTLGERIEFINKLYSTKLVVDTSEIQVLPLAENIVENLVTEIPKLNKPDNNSIVETAHSIAELEKEVEEEEEDLILSDEDIDALLVD